MNHIKKTMSLSIRQYPQHRLGTQHPPIFRKVTAFFPREWEGGWLSMGVVVQQQHVWELLSSQGAFGRPRAYKNN